jgi:phospholipid/cholesterol/gamma-HCH transport system substrate-binding protein
VRISLEPQQRRRVQVTADIDSAAPVSGRTLATLTLQGVTGLLFIELDEDPNAGHPELLAQGHRYPVIRSAPSDFDVLLESLPALATRTTELVDRFNRVFSDENVRAFKATLDNARAASERLPETSRAVQALVADMRRASHEVESAAVDLRAVTDDTAPDLKAAVANVRQITATLASTSEHLDRFVAENEPGLSRFTNQSLPELERLLRESRAAARDFRDLSRSLKENPSQLLYESNEHGIELPK